MSWPNNLATTVEQIDYLTQRSLNWGKTVVKQSSKIPFVSVDENRRQNDVHSV